MIRILAAAALAGATALPAAALDLDAMTDAERSAFRAEVRAYLLENPEVLMEAIGVLEAREAEAAAALDVELARANAEALFEDPASWSGGNPNGDLTLVEFIDYRCGFCKRAHPEVNELIETDGDIRIIRKEFPILGDQSVLASRFAVATLQIAGDEAYEQVSDSLMMMRSNVTDQALGTLGDTLDLPTEEIVAHMDSDAVTEVLRANQELAQRLQITGTPTFVLEDQMLRGYVPLDGLRGIVRDVRG